MNQRLLELEDELDHVKAWRDDLSKRIKQPQGNISDEEWVIMHRKMHKLNQHYSCTLAQYNELRREQDEK